MTAEAVVHDVVVSTIRDSASTVVNMACFHTRPAPANQRIAPETSVTSFHHLGTATSSMQMVAVLLTIEALLRVRTRNRMIFPGVLQTAVADIT
jgi:hypothetical protein